MQLDVMISKMLEYSTEMPISGDITSRPWFRLARHGFAQNSKGSSTGKERTRNCTARVLNEYTIVLFTTSAMEFELDSLRCCYFLSNNNEHHKNDDDRPDSPSQQDNLHAERQRFSKMTVTTASRRLFHSSSIVSRQVMMIKNVEPMTLFLDRLVSSPPSLSSSSPGQKQNQQHTVDTVHRRRHYSSSSKSLFVSSTCLSFASSSSSSTPPSSSRSLNFGDYIGSLRMRAAQALTSSLPEEEKSELLQRIGATTALTRQQQDVAIDDDDDDDVQQGASGRIDRRNGGADDMMSSSPDKYQHTIDEAVAAAKAREAERYEAKWEEEKEKIMAEAEEAARRRVESDLEIQRRQIAFEAWKRDLEKERQQQQQETAAVETEHPQQSREAAAATAVLGDHPILGACLVDLGHKRIHTASARALSAIPVWKRQRIYRHDRAKAMAKDKLKSLHLGLPGVIGLYESKDGSLRIIDGQHRIGMLKSLEESAKADGFDFDNILVEVYPQQDDADVDAHAQDIFLEINKAEPVKLVDLPGVAKASDRKIINEGADRLQERFPDMFSASQRCRAPHLNIDNLRDALFASTVLQRHSIKSSKALEEWMLAQNDILSVKYQSGENRNLVPQKAMEKAEKFDFYLGLDSSWLYN